MSISGNFSVLHSGSNLSDIMLLDQSHFPRPWTESDWKNLNFDHHLLFSLDSSELLGFSLFNLIPGDSTAHLLKICLTPKLRGKGLAQKFWQKISQELKSRGVTSVYLEVEKSNISAVKYYGKLGFQLLREISGFYSDGATALTMDLTL